MVLEVIFDSLKLTKYHNALVGEHDGLDEYKTVYIVHKLKEHSLMPSRKTHFVSVWSLPPLHC